MAATWLRRARMSAVQSAPAGYVKVALIMRVRKAITSADPGLFMEVSTH
jgi:hypothetical protein